MSLEAVKYNEKDNTLKILDQLVIPFQEKYITLNSISDAHDAIKNMQVRGAPAIAIVGMFSVAVEVNNVFKSPSDHYYYDIKSLPNFIARLIERVKFLVTSRPTAVNLSNSANEVISIIQNCSTKPSQLAKDITKFAVDLFEHDLQNNHSIGENGAKFILQKLAKQGFSGPFSVMTICNTGSLATSGYGTALGVVRSLWNQSKAKGEENDNPKKLSTKQHNQTAWLERVFPLETRPYNQGSRLTAFELVYENIPATLITDSMVSFLLESLENKRVTKFPPVKAIVVGADRIAANGDTANKIGTLQLAKLASLHGIMFLVAAPKSTIDPNSADGSEIVVEERPAEEMRVVKGGILQEDGKFEMCSVEIAPDIDVWNPSFDITSSSLITGIITEDGVQQYKEYA